MTRHREEISLDETPTYHWRGYDSGGTFVGELVTTGRKLIKKEIDDVLTPNYFSRLANGEFLPINPVSIKTTETLVSPGGGTSTWSLASTPPQPVTYIGDYDARFSEYPLAPFYTPSSGDIDAVVIKALSRAKSPEWDVLTFLGEWNETMALLGTAMDRLRSLANGKAYRAFKRETRRARKGKRSYNAKRAYKDFQNLWLEARYGWRPLIGDVQNAINALMKIQELGLRKATAKMRIDLTGVDQMPLFQRSYGIYARFDTTHERTGDCTIRAKVYHRSNMSNFGFNPITSAYELTRLSFVADWFVNVGGWLSAVSPRIGFNQLGISVSVKTNLTDLYTSKQLGFHGWSDASRDGIHSERVWAYTRVSYTGIPLPSIQLNLDLFKSIDLLFLWNQIQGDVGKRLRL